MTIQFNAETGEIETVLHPEFDTRVFVVTVRPRADPDLDETVVLGDFVWTGRHKLQDSNVEPC